MAGKPGAGLKAPTVSEPVEVHPAAEIFSVEDVPGGAPDPAANLLAWTVIALGLVGLILVTVAVVGALAGW